ncbi:MAG TPA: lamin tail domain-containing protein [Ignavibacteriales bacterium]|nr:lamin tail domain-containing protein [Ignavibacteriales bacterium]
MKSSYTVALISVLFFLLPVNTFSQKKIDLRISEIMFYAVSADNEYVEIFNPDYNNSIDLAHFAVKYYTSHADTIVSAGMGTLLKPRSYAVIFEGDYDLSSGIYKTSVPQEALVLKINNNSFGTSGMSNTLDRTLCLLAPGNDTLDIHMYSADNKAGISDERIVPDGPPETSSNWTNSLIPGGTPGQKNSVTPGDFDLSLMAIRIIPSNPIQEEAISVSLIIKNFGLKTADGFSVEAFLDRNNDSTGSPSERIYSGTLGSLQSRDSAVVTFRMPGLLPGTYRIIGIVNFTRDEIPLNNKKIFTFRVNPASGKYNDLVISEIMFAPSQGEPEWIELFNRSAATVNLKEWGISDKVSHADLTHKDVFLKPGSFIVITRDSSVRKYYDIPSEVLTCSLPSLNNTGDMIVIQDSAGVTIDSLEYTPPYGSGRSLERIDAEHSSTDASNWDISVSPFKATPGKPNSVARLDYDLALWGLTLRPEKPFPGSRIALKVKVKNTGRSPMDFSLHLFSVKSGSSPEEEKLSESAMLHLETQDSLNYEFNYSEILHGERLFIARLASTEDQNPTNNELRLNVLPSYPYNAFVVNEIMYMPESPEPEWVEIYNSSSDLVNIKNWTLSDIYSTPQKVTITKKDEYIQPGEFLVISRDSLIYSVHKSIPSKVIYLSLPALNNDKDGIVLKDAMGGVIDSVTYFSMPGHKTGYSLERRYTGESSMSPDNWGQSRSTEKSTPGQVNSLTPKEYDLSLEEISTTPNNPMSGDDVSINVKVTNCGLKDADGFSVNLFYRDYDSEVYNPLDLKTDLSLKKSDTINISFEKPLKSLKKEVYIAALITYTADKDTTNNYLQKLLQPGFRRNALLINEVMFAPMPGESEWMELVNVSEDTLNLKDWTVSQITPSAAEAKITSGGAPVYPGEFIILASDSSFLKRKLQARTFITPFGSLNNSGDIILICDIKGKVIDSLKYRGLWGDKKYSSIERISFAKETCDSTNWMPCPQVSTPGLPNAAIGLHQYSGNSAVINEIMYEPAKGNSEFIELYNPGSDEIDLSNWKIVNEKGDSYYLTDKSFTLSKGEYFIISSDSVVFNNYGWLKDSCLYSIKNISSLGLSNTGGLILLKDAFGSTIDSVHYLDSWHSKTVHEVKDRSLERINPLLCSNDPSNWRTCVSKEGATPGRLNSIFVLNQKSEARFSILPNPFSPDDDGFEDFTIINYNLPDDISSVAVKVFDSQGRLVRTIASQTLGSRGSIVFDGMSEDGSPLRMGIYIVLLQALNSSNSVGQTIKSVVVVARKL